ncbi:MAG: GTP-binding protein [Eubacterium sp.]|nr:GTP-binding protein [Eubacterium sp.]
MNILVVSGFLGAGKTTFIQELIRRTRKKFVVLENEFGDTDIDEATLKVDDNTDVWGLSEGCVCCTKSADLTGSVMTIESVLSPDFLIVEPSGVGKLGNVMANLQKLEYERITLLRPITVIDGLGFRQDLAEYGDIYTNQIDNAGTVVISKPDRCEPELYEAIRDRVLENNPDARVLDCHYTKMDDEWFDMLLREAYSGEILEEEEADSGLKTCTIRGGEVSSATELLYLLDYAVRGAFGDIIRAKGMVRCGDEVLGFHIASGQISVQGLDETEEELASQSVWIGSNIDRFGLMEHLHSPVISFGNLFRRDAAAS